MVSDRQVSLLFDLVRRDRVPIKEAAVKASLSEPTAHKYLRSGLLPSQCKKPRIYRTRIDAFAEVWLEVVHDLEANPEIQTTEVFSNLQKKYPGRFKPGQLRTLQRRVKEWRDWQPKEIYFEQVYLPEHQEYQN